MESKHVHRIAMPCERLAVRLEEQASHVAERPIRAMLARYPLRVIERQWPWRHRDFFGDVKHVLPGLGNTDREVDATAGVTCQRVQGQTQRRDEQRSSNK